jgi:two-component system cell cycle response regulator
MTAKILIVDDIKFNIDLLQAKLQRECYAIYRASNGKEALSKAMEIKPDIILMDIMMPLMDGLTATKLIRRTQGISFIPIIIVTALDSEEDKVSSLLCEADCYVVKPINHAILIARIKSLLRFKFITEELLMRLKIHHKSEELVAHHPLAFSMDTNGAKILLIDDNTRQALLISSRLRRDNFMVDICSDAHEKMLKNPHSNYNLIIINVSKRDDYGINACMKIRSNAAFKHIPMITLMDECDEELLIKSLEIGMNDYVLMPLSLKELSAKALLQIKKFRYQEQLKRIYSENSSKDELTGLYNRTSLNSYFAQVIEKMKKEGKNYTLCMIDIDNFKNINDTYGHIAGDEILKDIAKIIFNNVRSTDFVARFGGEEFVAILQNVTINQTLVIAEKIKQKLVDSKIFDISGKNFISCTVSTGIDEIKVDDTLQNIIDRADKKLYRAKALGKNTIVA